MDTKKAHLILTGATGLVGSATLYSMLRNEAIGRISIFTRPKSDVLQATDSDIAQQKCRVFRHEDFGQPPSSDALNEIRDAKGIVWALGVSQNEVDEQTYSKITVDWPLLWARALARRSEAPESPSQQPRVPSQSQPPSTPNAATPSNVTDSGSADAPQTGTDTQADTQADTQVDNPADGQTDASTAQNDTTDASPTQRPLNFVYVSGEGATANPGKFTPRFARVKGIAEKELLNLGTGEASIPSLSVYIARAGGVDRANHDEITPYTAAREGLQKKLERPLRFALRYTYKNIMSPTPELGDALVQLAMRDGEPMPEGPGVEGEGRIIRNVGLRQMAGLPIS
ncbi:MAG: hypothetical protein Q9162_001345 [Coniocarpon cinnabarinum]